MFRISAKGDYSEVLRLPAHPRAAAVIDCVAIDRHRRLYVNHVTEGKCHRFEWDGKRYEKQRELGAGVHGTKKSIAVDQQDNVFIVVMSGVRQTILIRIDSSGEETYFSIPHAAVNIAVDDNEKLYIPLISKGIVGVFTYDAKLVSEIPLALEPGHSPADIAIGASGDLYLPIFHNGQILQIEQGSKLINQVRFIPGNFGTPGGIAFDTNGRMFISNFAGDEIFVTY